jgi:hypothetical protein
MAGLTKQINAPNSIFGTVCSNSGKSPSEEDVGVSPLGTYGKRIYVRYLNHVLFNRSSAMAMVSQIVKQICNAVTVEMRKTLCFSLLKKLVEVAA